MYVSHMLMAEVEGCERVGFDLASAHDTCKLV